MMAVVLGWVIGIRCLVLDSGWVFVRRIRFGTLWVSVGCCLVVTG